MAVGVPGVVSVCSAVLVIALGAQNDGESPRPGEVAIPEELAGYSHFTGSVSDSPPGAAVALYQHGFGVEFLDFPQAVALGAGGDVYRRVDAAEDRAGAETQGDPAPMLLSPDGTTVAVGDHDIDQPDVVIVDLVTGATTHHDLPTGRSVVPIAWSSDGRRLAHLLSPAPTNPHSGERIVGDIGVLDLDDGDTTLLQDGQVSAAAFSPDGTELALQQDGDDGELSVVDLASGSRRAIEAEGVLAGPTAWSPDGRLLALTTLRPAGAPPGVSAAGVPTGLSFVDPTGQGGDAPAPLELSLSPQGHVLGWSGPDEVLTLLPVPGTDTCCGPDAYNLSTVPLGGGQPRTLMHIPGLQSYGVARFQLAAATVDDLRVVTPADVDRGRWPLPLRGSLAVLVGLLAWGVTRTALRRTRTRPTSRQDDQAQVRDQHALTGS